MFTKFRLSKHKGPLPHAIAGVYAQKMGRATPKPTARDIERILRNCGFSRNEAKKITIDGLRAIEAQNQTEDKNDSAQVENLIQTISN